MRIAQLVETLHVGGLERIAVDLALAHHAAGHSVAVYCFFAAGPLRAELDRAGIPVAEFHKDRRSNAAVVWAMARRLRADRIEVLHAHNPGVQHAAALAKALSGTRVCLNTRHSALSSTGAPYQERYFRAVGPLIDHVVFDCEYVRRELEPRLRFPASRYSVILNGIALEKFRGHPAAPGTLRPRLRFGTVGRLVPAKGHAVLIDAFARIAGRLPDADLRIFGYGELETELRERVRRLGMEDRIRLEGRADNPAAVFEDLDVFVLSSVNEGLPLVVMEAMAAGLPIVSASVGGVPEIAPANLVGRLCAPGSVDELADAMLAMAADPELAAMGRRARERALAEYGADRMSARYLGLYRRLLDGAR